MFFDLERMVEDYTFDKCSTHLVKALTWLQENCESIDFELFGNEEFYGMPKELYKKLSQDDISYIQLYGNDYLLDSTPGISI